MADAIVKFEREEREGAVPVGTYLDDVIKRLGIPAPDACDPTNLQHNCVVTVISGSELLSPRTSAETEHFKATERTEDARLACETQIISVGEVVIMTEEKKVDPKGEQEKSKIVDDFQALPLERKLAELLRMEAVALGETLTFVVNSPYLVIEKIGDVLAEFGMKMDRESKKARAEPKVKVPADDAPSGAHDPSGGVPHDTDHASGSVHPDV